MKTSTPVHYFAASIYILLSLEGCSTSHPTVSAKPASTTRADSTTPEIRSNSWAPQVSTGTWHYLIRDSSVVSINNDTTAHVEPIESTTIYTMSVADSNNSLLFTGHVDSLVVNSGLSTKSAGDTTRSTELRALISKQGQLMRISQVTPTSCAGAGNSPSLRMGELLAVLPAHPVRVGDKWSDTSSATTCHGKIPLTQTAVREYELLELSSCQRNGAKVRRIVSEMLSGSSPETTNHLSASGSGTASAILCLDRNTGVLLASDGESRLNLTVTTIRGVFPFTQKTSTHIEAR